MIGIDTNVLVRYLTNDDNIQSPLAEQWIMYHCSIENPIFINRVVLCELVWVLSRAYRYSRLEIAIALEKILTTKQFVIDVHEVLWKALLIYKESEMDFADALIGFTNQGLHCAHTITFDEKASINPSFRLLKDKVENH